MHFCSSNFVLQSKKIGLMSHCKSCCTDETHEVKHSHNPNSKEFSPEEEHNHGFGYKGLIFSLIVFFLGLILQYVIKSPWFINNEWVRLCWFAVAYLPVAKPVWQEAIELFAKKDFFNEFSLMV